MKRRRCKAVGTDMRPDIDEDVTGPQMRVEEGARRKLEACMLRFPAAPGCSARDRVHRRAARRARSAADRQRIFKTKADGKTRPVLFQAAGYQVTYRFALRTSNN